MTEEGTVEVVPYAPPWLSLLLFVRWRILDIQIERHLGEFHWGSHAFSVPPGEHRVAVALGWGRASPASAKVNVVANEVVRLRYTPHVVPMLPGKLEIELPDARVLFR
jgi:hypothetical protein